MRPYTIVALTCLISSCFLACEFTTIPQPTNGATLIHEGEEEGNQDKRLKWINQMHRTADHTSWTQLEYQNQLTRIAQKGEINFRSDCNAVSIANDKLRGTWMERGSLNLAGSVLDTEYDPIKDEIWLISAGGTLWRGKRDGSHWTPVNQDLIFSAGLLVLISNRPHTRMLALINKVPHYSDDEGLSWTMAQGAPVRNDFWGGAENVVVLGDNSPTIFLLGKPDYWSKLGLYVSSDAGLSYQKIRSFETHLFEKIHLSNPHHSQSVFLIDNSGNEAHFFEYTPHSGVFTPLEMERSFSFGEVKVNLSGWATADSLRLYSYRRNQGGDMGVFLSTDKAKTWIFQGKLPKTPWEVGMYVSPTNPNVLFMGEVDCYRSLNGGKEWTRVNRWSEYYDDMEHKLHADIMHFKAFKTLAENDFLLISHHGGLTISYDDLATQQNISLSGLNVSQYYTVVTDPLDPNFVYAGSQDQGFQRSATFEDEAVEIEQFEQVISGDYAHLTFSKKGESLWAVYPDGWITYYDDPQQQGYHLSYQLEEDNRSELWLPPIMSSPNSEEDAVYMAGGNIVGDGGSYLIKLRADGNRIHATAGDFNFKQASGGGEISAMASAPSHPDYWYVATSNGRFFYSQDAGATWSQSLNFVVQGQYFFGQAIYVSRFDPNKVYLAGSGYDNPAVFVSTDGGGNFTPLLHNLPPTLVLGLTADPAEQFLFAATETGPFVYVVEDARWYPLLGDCSPTQTYWSVEYVAALHIARFGTHGRGIWDFVIDPTVATDGREDKVLGLNIKVYPNPITDWLKVETNSISAKPIRMKLFGANGQFLQQYLLEQPTTSLDLGRFPGGVYWLQFEQNGETLSKQIVITH